MTPDCQLQKPIIIIGAPRSGTTFLGKLFGAHPNVAYLVEPRMTWRYGNDRKSDMLRAEDARPEVCSYIRRAFAETVRNRGKQRLAEKTPSNALRLAFVDQVFPDCRFIHIIRNGFQSAVSIHHYWQNHTSGIGRHRVRKGVLSQRLRELSLRRVPYYAKEFARRIMPEALSRFSGPRVWGPRIPAIESLVCQLGVLEVCCLQWRMCVESACYYGRKLPPHRYMECKLEELTQDRVNAMFAFCELDNNPNVQTCFEQTFDPTRPAGRVPQIDPEQRQRILQWIEPTLRWLEYPVPSPP